MPYIVCINQPGCLPEQEPYAVATLEEARHVAYEPLSARYANRVYREASRAIEGLSESGGVIGPLPDGYVIDVQFVNWDVLTARARARRPFLHGTHQDYLNAYNAS